MLAGCYRRRIHSWILSLFTFLILFVFPEYLPFTSNLSYNLHFYECSTSFLLALTLLSVGSALIHSNVPFQEELIAHLLIAVELHLQMIQAVVPKHPCVTNVHANRYATHRGKCNVGNFLLYNLQIINANHLVGTPIYQCSLNTSYEANWLLWKHNRQKQAHNI